MQLSKIHLGVDYPLPIIFNIQAKSQALKRYQDLSLKQYFNYKLYL